KLQLKSPYLRNRRSGIMRLLQVLFCNLTHSVLSHRRQIDSGHQCEQPLVRANVRGRFLTPNMLFASGQRKHVTTPTLTISRLAAESPRLLSDVFVEGCKHSAVRTAITQRYSKGLSFTCDYIRSTISR